MKKIFYFSVLISAAFLAQIAPADAQLPSSPLNEEYALTGAESVGNTWGGTYEIGAAGVLNISGGGMPPSLTGRTSGELLATTA